MKIFEIMTSQVDTAKPDSTLTDVAIRLREKDVGSLPVVDRDRVIGVITDRDIVVRGVANSLNPDATTARDVMTEEVIWVGKDDDVKEALDLMKDKQLRRILVLDNDKALAGIVAQADIAREQKDDRTTREVVEKISQPN